MWHNLHFLAYSFIFNISPLLDHVFPGGVVDVKIF